MKKILVLFFTVLSLSFGQAVVAMDDDEEFDITELFAKSAEETDEQKILSSVDAASLMALLETSKISRDQALLILINNTPGSGSQLEEKINALIKWHDTYRPDVDFIESDNIWKLVQNYAPNQRLFEEQRIQSLPAWIKWFINHGPHNTNGSARITSRGNYSASVIDLAISYDYPAVVVTLLEYGQKPSDNGIHYAIQKNLKNILAVLPQDQVARVSGKEPAANAPTTTGQTTATTRTSSSSSASSAPEDQWGDFLKSMVHPDELLLPHSSELRTA